MVQVYQLYLRCNINIYFIFSVIDTGWPGYPLFTNATRVKTPCGMTRHIYLFVYHVLIVFYATFYICFRFISRRFLDMLPVLLIHLSWHKRIRLYTNSALMRVKDGEAICTILVWPGNICCAKSKVKYGRGGAIRIAERKWNEKEISIFELVLEKRYSLTCANGIDL